MTKKINRLYDMQKTIIETYAFKINNYGISEQELCNLPRIEIVFANKKFRSANFSFQCPYTKAQWEVLEAISQKIKEIENKLRIRD